MKFIHRKFDIRFRIIWRAYNKYHEKSFSSNDISEKLGGVISFDHIGALANGAKPTAKEIVALAKVFKVDPKWLSGENDTPPTWLTPNLLSSFDAKEVGIAAFDAGENKNNSELLSSKEEYQAVVDVKYYV